MDIHKGHSLNPPWGTYAPCKRTFLLRFLTVMGLSRGSICRWVKQKWLQWQGAKVDAVVRGCRYRLDIEHNTTDGKILTSSKFYDREEIEALSPPPGQTDHVFLDVGANTGYYSLQLALRGCQRVIAIEANPPTVNLLSQNVALNGLENKIKVFPYGVGEGGRLPFYCSGGLGSASLLQSEPGAEPILVETAPLLHFLNKAEISRVDAMKIDIEGYEDRALEPFFATAPKALWPSVVVIESCNRAEWKKDIIRFMIDLGFREVRQTRGNTILRLSVGKDC